MKRIILILLFFGITANAQNIFKNEFEQNIATRISTINLVDPHPYVDYVFCVDGTNYLNNTINDSMNNDGDGDGFIDDSVITQFYTDQPDYITGRDLIASVIDSDCPYPLHSAACEPEVGASPTFISTVPSQINDCLNAIPGTESPAGYSPPINTISAPCYVSEPQNFTLNLLNGATLPLSGYQQAEKYEGGLTMSPGLIRGFVSQADAEAFNFTVHVNGNPLNLTLAEILPGHPNNCKTPTLNDMDLGPDGITQGWWLYFNITSELVEFDTN